MERYLSLTEYLEDDTAVRSVTTNEIRRCKLVGAKAALIQIDSGTGLYVRLAYGSDPATPDAGCRKVTSEAFILISDYKEQPRLNLKSIDGAAVGYRIIWCK